MPSGSRVSGRAGTDLLVVASAVESGRHDGPMDAEDAEDEGGDPVCWAHLLCPACGAMPDPDEPSSGTCPRCGEELPR